jgi:hypothetical protein
LIQKERGERQHGKDQLIAILDSQPSGVRVLEHKMGHDERLNDLCDELMEGQASMSGRVPIERRRMIRRTRTTQPRVAQNNEEAAGAEG